ncbi:MAG: lipoprotein [Pseudomonadota bacterium]
MPHAEKKAVSLIAATLVVLALAGCGVRGSLEAPAEAKAAGTAASSESADPGANSAASKTTAHKPFILDDLIR